MEQMVKEDRYAYMRDLLRLRNFQFNTQYDMTRRSWLGKGLVGGHFIEIFPANYGAPMCEDLLRIALSIQVRENVAAQALGIAPRFTLITAEEILLIDFYWSLYALHRPFHALKIYKEVCFKGELVEVPEVPRFPKVEMPPPRYYDLGDLDELTGTFDGVRDIVLESFEDYCRIETRKASNGKEVLDIGHKELSPSVRVSEEWLWVIFEIREELEKLLAYHDDRRVMRTMAVKHYLQSGAITLSERYIAREADRILRRSLLQERAGLLQMTPAELIAASRFVPELSAQKRAVMELRKALRREKKVLVQTKRAIERGEPVELALF